MQKNKITVIHSTPVWLPQTTKWIYNQVRCLPDHIGSHVKLNWVSTFSGKDQSGNYLFIQNPSLYKYTNFIHKIKHSLHPFNYLHHLSENCRTLLVMQLT